MNIGSLFSGYGGLDLAVEAVLGGVTAWHSEVDPHASKLLELRWPGVANLGDITAIDWSTVEPVDVVCGGFPCQDISSAGRGAGIKEGTRSGLWYRYADAVRVLRPRLVFVENVGALVVQGLDIVLGDLAALGYDAEWTCLRASDVGAPHRRERLFLLAWPADTDGPRRKGADDQGRRPPVGGHAAAHAARLGHVRPRLARDRWPGPADRGDIAPDAGGARLGEHTRGAPTEEAGARGGDLAVDPGGERPHRDGGAPAADPGGVGRVRRTGGVRDGWDAAEWSEAGDHAGDSDQAWHGRLLPTTTTATDAAGSRGRRLNGEPYGPTSGVTLTDAVTSMDWGPYAQAVARWERITGHPAPAPTDDRGRLNAPFAEWMMGLPLGWVTGPDVEDMRVPRSAMLRMIGNGVVPRQATAALRVLLERAARPFALVEAP